jgi:hypothetical protein
MHASHLQTYRHPLRGLLVYVFVLSVCWGSNGQNVSKRISGPHDIDIAIPDPPTPLVRQDSAALAELTAHLKTVGPTLWVALKGTGSMSYSETGQDPVPVTICLAGKDRFRLDETTAKGNLSIRTHDSVGEVITPDSKPILLPPETATVGSIHFQLLRLAEFPDPSTSFIDKGLVTVNGRALHRIATDVATRQGIHGGPHPRVLVPLDLYFDPQTHLLIKSATLIKLPSSGREPLLQVMTYSNYQSVNGVLLPFSFRETIDGEFHWAITLTQADLISAPSRTFFTF